MRTWESRYGRLLATPTAHERCSVICGATPTYGFHYNETRDGLLIHEPEMLVVEKIFHLVAAGVAVRAAGSQGRVSVG
jgi:predicted aconitase